MNTTFEALTGDQWYFHPPSAGRAYAGQVAHWAHVSQLGLTFNYRKVGHDDSPCWISQPVLEGEYLGHKYFGYGTSKREAKEEVCRKMASSGNCVVGLTSI
ncbi:unnamed protein product [Rhizoctonia solani]|uniref:Uncharacterized protein n=1 Tax=Rhizoctonia solani TaxID=456999 RepID=A0A8H3GQQ4_9AGAM|nr:unnamed protein product [Rhizoctonia solani]